MKLVISRHILSLKSTWFASVNYELLIITYIFVSLLLLVNQSVDSDVDERDTGDGDDVNSDDLEACSSSLSDLCFSSLDIEVLASCSPPTSSQSTLSRNPSFRSQELRKASLPETLKENPVIHETPHPKQLPDWDVEGAPSTCPAYPDSQSSLASASPLDVRSDWKTSRWPILPPITPQRGEHL